MDEVEAQRRLARSRLGMLLGLVNNLIERLRTQPADEVSDFLREVERNLDKSTNGAALEMCCVCAGPMGGISASTAGEAVALSFECGYRFVCEECVLRIRQFERRPEHLS